MNTIVRKSIKTSVILLSIFVLLVVAVPKAAYATPTSFPLYSWGLNSTPGATARLGRPITAQNPENLPGRVGTANNWVQSSTSMFGAYAINTEGELFAWGAQSSAPQMGQAGLVGGGVLSSPTQVETASNWTQVSARDANVLALNSQGQMFNWGGSTYMGGPTNVPTQVGTASNWVYVVAANHTGFAINDQGHLYSWGRDYEQLGRAVTAQAPANLPGRVGERSDWASVSTGGHYVLGLTESGQMWSWGTPASGLAMGRSIDAANPADRPGQVGTASNWVDVRATNLHSAAINSAGELWTWGVATSTLGRDSDSANPANRPGRVGTADDWTSVQGGNAHFLAFNTDGELWGWGGNTFGQLALGDNISRYVPTFILQTEGYSAAARGGGTFSILLIEIASVGDEFPLEKQLQKPAGTPVPNLSFTFTFTPHSFNNNTANVTPLPTIPTRTVTINNTNTSTPNYPSTGITTTTNSVDALAGIQFTQPGIYAWTVTEVQSATGVGANSSVVFSQASYRLRVYVAQEAGIGGNLYIYSTIIQKLTDDAGDVVYPNEKVSNLSFINTYIRTRPADALAISKTVTGQFANLSTPFSFQVTVTRTALCPPTTNFTGRIMQGNAQIGANIPFASGVQQTITLTDGQRLVFDSLVVGTQFNVTELAAPEYTASVELVVDGQAVTIAPNTAPNLPLPLGNHLVGAAANTADFTNAHAAPPPTGLSVEGIPVALVFVAGMVLTASLAIRARKRVEELAVL